VKEKREGQYGIVWYSVIWCSEVREGMKKDGNVVRTYKHTSNLEIEPEKGGFIYMFLPTRGK
jgi:hypothetical protein